MKIVIAGAGSVGRYMAEQLSESGHTVRIVDNDAEAVARARSVGVSIEVVQGDACEIDTLARVGCRDADVVAAVTGDDVVTLRHSGSDTSIEALVAYALGQLKVSSIVVCARTGMAVQVEALMEHPLVRQRVEAGQLRVVGLFHDGVSGCMFPVKRSALQSL